MRHRLWPAAQDLCLTDEDQMVLVTRPPARWDELLDVGLPLLIGEQVNDWSAIGQSLGEAGLGPDRPIRLVESNGQVTPIELRSDYGLYPQPESQEWILCIGWTHFDEGWRARRPLSGYHYLVTRARDQGGELVTKLRNFGATVTHAPTIAFTEPDDLQPWREALGKLRDFDWVLFTSPNGVRFFLDRLQSSTHDLRALGNARLACIGPSTAECLAERGLKADLVPPEYVAESLLESLAKVVKKGEKVLLPRAQVARPVLPDGLRELGCEVSLVPIYKTIKPELDLEELPDSARLLFTSSSTVQNWVQQFPDSRQACICIGPVTESTALESGLEVLGCAKEYTINGLVAEVLRLDAN